MLAKEKGLPKEEELQRMSRYCVALNRTDKVTLSAYVSSNIFELVIDLWLEQQGIIYSDDDSLNNKIYMLNIAGLPYTKSTLTTLRLIRNNIVHGYIHSIKSNEVQELVLFIWEVLDDVTFIEYAGRIEDLDIVQAHYWIRDFEVLDSKSILESTTLEKKIEQNDFNNLFSMSEKLFAFSEYIDTRKKLRKYNLSIDNISKANPTSAYVWLAITSGNYQSRQKIESSSVSILATPENIRIYIDFGGLAFEDRQYYYNFLESIDRKSIGLDKIDDLCLIDIEWYSYITERYDIDILNSPDKKDLVDSAKERLHNNVGFPMTWNKLLIGYIMDRRTLSFELLWEKLDTIIAIYEQFQHYKDACRTETQE